MGYQPNQIPFKERVLCCAASLFLLVYGSVAWYLGDLYVPARRGGVHLTGWPMMLMLAAMAFATLAMMLIVIDHFDRRDNERHYRIISIVIRSIAWTCFGLSLLCDLAIHKGWLI